MHKNAPKLRCTKYVLGTYIVYYSMQCKVRILQERLDELLVLKAKGLSDWTNITSNTMKADKTYFSGSLLTLARLGGHPSNPAAAASAPGSNGCNCVDFPFPCCIRNKRDAGILLCRFFFKK